MSWVIFALGAVLSWGIYGAMLARGHAQLGNPMKALLFVGVAYFLVAILIPVGMLTSQGDWTGFNSTGVWSATIAGILGAAGAVCIIWAFRAGGTPQFVMPIVFGGAPIVNVLFAMSVNPPKNPPATLWYVGLMLAVIGAGMVLYFRPH